MNPNEIAVLLTPVFIALMGVEALVARAQGIAPYGHRQTLNNFGVLVGARALLSAFGIVPLLGYAWMVEHLALIRLDAASPWTWLLGFFAVDFAIWLRHWAAHRTGALWAMHAVHHQSREYNLSVAARLSWFADTVLVGLPLALVGLPLEVTTAWFVVGNAWMLVQHTETIGRLGVLDRLLLTPSNHRVHHGSNPRYLDKNYGGILLVWDRLFGTFEPETEPVRYGVLTGLRTYDATENNFEPLRMLWQKMVAAPSLWGAVQCLWRPPGWSPGRGEGEAVMIAEPEPQRASTPTLTIRVLSTSLMGVALIGSLWLGWNAQTWSMLARITAAAAVLFLVSASGVLLDMRPLQPVRATTTVGRGRAYAAAVALALAGPYAKGPLYAIGKWLEPEGR